MTVTKMIITIALISIIITHVVSTRIDPRSYSINRNIDGVPINFTQALIVEEIGCVLTALDLNKKGNSLKLKIKGKSGRECSFDLYEKNTIYYNYDYSVIGSSANEFPELKLPANYKPQETEPELKYSIAVDFISKKIYATSWDDKFESAKVIVIDIQNNNFGIVLTNLKLPKYLVLDPSEGLMFIGQLSTILRSNLDGTKLEKIVEKYGISELAIDRQSKRIYWVNLVSIESSNYAGGDRKVITTTKNPAKSLSVVGNQLFWLTPPYGMNPKTTIWTCKITASGICGASSQIPFDGEPKFIKSYDFDELQSSIESKKNPCKDDNGGCEHLCLLINDRTKTHNCACNLGYQLNEDLQTCSLANDEFLLYAQENYFKGRILDHYRSESNISTTFVDTIYPNRFKTQLSSGQVINFDYDFNDNLVYFNGYRESGLDVKKLLPSHDQEYGISAYNRKPYCAVDWVSKIVYSYSIGDSVIRVTRGLEPFVYKTVELDRSLTVYSIVVHPNRGYVYFIGHNQTSEKSGIYRVKNDLTNLEPFLKNNHVRKDGLALDYAEDRLYWFSTDGTKLESVNLNGSLDTIRSIDVSIVAEPRSVSVYQQWAYISNLTNIWRLDKTTEHNAAKLIDARLHGGSGMVSGAHIYARSAQPYVGGHPCAVDNGGCQTFCFAIPTESGKQLRLQCGCADYKKLQIDGMTCM